MTAGDIYTIAGTVPQPQCLFSGDGGPATKAALCRPTGVALAGGNVVIADSGNNRLRMVAVRTGTFFGRAMTAGDIYTVAGDGTLGFAGDGGPATKAQIGVPGGVVVNGAGNLLIADYDGNRIRSVAG